MAWIIAFLAGIFAVGSVWFWLLLLISSILIVTFVEWDEGGWATLTLVVTVVLLNWAYKLPIFKTIAAHPWQVLGWVAVYFLAGMVWGLFKWFLFVHKSLARYNELRVEFLQRYNVTQLTPELAVKLKEYAASGGERGSYGNGASAIPPSTSSHKGDITRWMTYWPFSVLGTILNDFVRRAWTHIYNFMVGLYDKIALHAYRKASIDMELANEYALEQATKKKQQTDDVVGRP